MHYQRSVPNRHSCEASSRLAGFSVQAGRKPELPHEWCEKLFQFWAMRFLLPRSESLNLACRGLKSLANSFFFMALVVLREGLDDPLVGAATCVFTCAGVLRVS